MLARNSYWAWIREMISEFRTVFVRSFSPLLAISAFLMLLSGYARLMVQAFYIKDLWSVGFPLAFREWWSPCPPGQSCADFSIFSLILNLVFWYALCAGGVGVAQMWFRPEKGGAEKGKPIFTALKPPTPPVNWLAHPTRPKNGHSVPVSPKGESEKKDDKPE